MVLHAIFVPHARIAFCSMYPILHAKSPRLADSMSLRLVVASAAQLLPIALMRGALHALDSADRLVLIRATRL